MFWTVAFFAVVIVALPYGAWSTRRFLLRAQADSFPSSRAMALQSIAIQIFVCALALAALAQGAPSSSEQSSSEISLQIGLPLAPTAMAVTALFLLVAIAMASIEARKPLQRGDLIRRKLREEGVSAPVVAMIVAASVGEEIVYRGVLPLLLSPLDGLPAAVGLSAALFGLAHMAQGWRGVMISAILALGLHLIVLASGGLLLAMIAHLLYDFAAAFLGARLPLREAEETLS